MASSSREARRRKILERGSDRLAFITGQINDVPPPPPPPPSSDPTSLSQSHLPTDDTVPPRDQTRTDRGTAFTSHQENTSDALFDNVNHIIHQRRAESLQPHKYTETSAEASASTTLQQPSPATSTTQTPPVVDLGASQAFTPLVSFANTITPNHIGAAIDASEYARMFSSLVIALLVILSHLGFSSLGSSIVSFRPVFLLLLTDATIVLGRVLLSHRGAPSSASRRENSGQGIAAQVGNALETVMMIKKIMNAISMDFSLYAVILICGLLFTQNIFA
ncbi:hypothetical protein DY000_02036767 [Brassica cretica]|uniref:Uncharacterized protein n=1 Tax=Brassica cretica TaxID=69181 RepID=A0ABQ7BBQ1_BRACR|nr:hypothetical protein DY000_02036767 [Brassica cretica]